MNPILFKTFPTVSFLVIFLNVSSLLFSQNTVKQDIKSFKFMVPQLNTEKEIWVYLPKSYANSKKAYPVIYMHDGQNLFDAALSYAGEWKVDDYLDTLTKNESIIIGIAHGNEKRIEELTPYVHERYGGGKGNAYLDFIITDLMPYIETHYRIKKGPEHTTIFGSSLGGLISFYAALKYPNVFGKAGVFSPSFWINTEIYELVEQASISKSTMFYFLVGTEEGDSMVPDMEKMVALLKSKGMDETRLKSEIVEGAKHNEAFWASHFPEAYQWLISNN